MVVLVLGSVSGELSAAGEPHDSASIVGGFRINSGF